MPEDVQTALQGVCAEWGGMSEEEAHSYLASLISSHRLQLETWS